jgi:hypothetical protein
MAIFARIDDEGQVQLINHIGVRLGNDRRRSSTRTAFAKADIEYETGRVPPIKTMHKTCATSRLIRPA